MLMPRYPGLGSTGRHGYTDTKTLLQRKPRRKGATQLRAAMIDDMEVVLGQLRGDLAALEAT
jgi:hypothetical protein